MTPRGGKRGPSRSGLLGEGAACLITAHTNTCACQAFWILPKPLQLNFRSYFYFLGSLKLDLPTLQLLSDVCFSKERFCRLWAKDFQLPGTVVTFLISRGRALNSTWTSEHKPLGPLSQLLTVEVLPKRSAVFCRICQYEKPRAMDKVQCNDAEIGCKRFHLVITKLLKWGCDYIQIHLGIWWRM